MPFVRYVEKHGKAGQGTDGNIIRGKLFECCVTTSKTTDTHSEYVIVEIMRVGSI